MDDEVWTTRELDSRESDEISHTSIQRSIADVERSTADVESSNSSHLIPRDTILDITTTLEPDLISDSQHILIDVGSTYSDTSALPNISADVLATDVDSSSGTNESTTSHTPQESVISSGGPEASMTMIATTSPDDATFLSTESTETKNDFVSATPLKTTGEVSSSTLRAVNLLPSVQTSALFPYTSMLKIPNPSSDDSAVSTTSHTMAIQSTLSYSFDILEELTSSFHDLSSDGTTVGLSPTATTSNTTSTTSTTTSTTATTFTATTKVGTISSTDVVTTRNPPDPLDTISSDEPSTIITTTVDTTSTSLTDVMTTTIPPDVVDTASTDWPYTTTTATTTVGAPSTLLTDEMTTTIFSDVLDTASTTTNETTTWTSGNNIFTNSECGQPRLLNFRMKLS